MQRITLRPLGPIKSVEIPVKGLIVFIGPQASGKSTICKAIFFFRSLRDDLVKYILDSVQDRSFDKPLGTYGKRIRAKFLEFWGPSSAFGEILAEYDYGNGAAIKITLDGPYVSPEFNGHFKSGFHRIVGKAKDFSGKFPGRDKAFLSSSDLLASGAQKRAFLRQLDQLAKELFNDTRDLFFVPAGRSLAATLCDQLQSIHPHRLDYLTRAFVDRIGNTRPQFMRGLQGLVDDRKALTQEQIPFDYLRLAEKAIRNILKADYVYEPEGEKLFYDDRHFTKLNYSSSGQQESLWILLLIFLLILERRQSFVVFEEPEAHLYPEAQQEMVHLISLLSNAASSELAVTTHSPYILSALNNLLYAHNLGTTKPDRIAEIVDNHLWVNPQRVGAYFVSDGVARDILDEETGLIHAEAIDSASDAINGTFDRLFQLDDAQWPMKTSGITNAPNATPILGES